MTWVAGAPLLADDLNAEIFGWRPLAARLASNFALAASSTTFQNVTGLSVSLPANTTWDGLLHLGASNAGGDNVEDIKCAMTWPAGATVDTGDIALVVGVTTVSGDVGMVHRASASSGSALFDMGLTTSPVWGLLVFRIAVGGTAGTLQVQAAQNVSGTDVTSVLAGSKLRLDRAA